MSYLRVVKGLSPKEVELPWWGAIVAQSQWPGAALLGTVSFQLAPVGLSMGDVKVWVAA